MSCKHPSELGLLLMLVVVFLLSACAPKIPPTLPLEESEKSFVINRLQEFQDRVCSQSIDADITLEWNAYGKTQKVAGMLQLQLPAFLRYSVVDPLGRQLFILVSDGDEFTLVHNIKAEAVTGLVDSNFWRTYIPEYLQPEDYLSWLTGRLPVTGFAVDEIRKDTALGSAVWLVSKWKNDTRQRVLFYPELLQLGRHIVEGKGNKILFDVTYAEYEPADQSCRKPTILFVEGAEITGTVTIVFDEILPAASIPDKVFHLSIPDHFTVNTFE